MKKLRLGKINLAGAEVLSREQLKRVMGGSGSGSPGGDNGDPCPNNCTKYCSQTFNGGSINYTTEGPCSPNTGGTSCHNFCCDGGSYNNGSSYWC